MNIHSIEIQVDGEMYKASIFMSIGVIMRYYRYQCFQVLYSFVMPDESPTLLRSSTSKPTKLEYLALLSVTMAKLGDSVEFVLPAIITQPVSCELGLSRRQEQTLALVLYISVAVFSVVTIPFLRRFPRKPIILFSLYMSIIASVLCAIMPDYISLIVSRIILGATIAVSMTPLSVYISEISPNKRFYTISTVINTIGWSSGGGWCGILGYLFLERLGWRWFVLLTSVPLFILPIIMFQFFLPETKKEKIEDRDCNRLSEDNKIVTTEKAAMKIRILKTQLVAVCSLVIYFGGMLLLPALIKEDNLRNDRDIPCKSIHGVQFLTVSLLFGVCHILGKVLWFVLHNLGTHTAISLTFLSITTLGAHIAIQFSYIHVIFLLFCLGVVQTLMSAMGSVLNFLSYDKFFFTEQYLPISSAIRLAMIFLVTAAASFLPEFLYYTTVLQIHLGVSVAVLLTSFLFFHGS